MSKIILIALPSPFASEPAMNPTLGLCYIAGYLKKNGYDNIEAVDYNLYKECDYFNSKDYLRKIPPGVDFYGIYCMTPQFIWLKDVIKDIRQKSPKAKIIVGGPHASTCPEECLRVAKADIAVKGEGEEAFFAIVSGEPLEHIKGVCFLGKDGKFHDSERAFVKNLDDLPFPDRDLFDMDKYKRTIHGEKAVHIVTLRGCPYSCAFCDKKSVGTNVRFRSMENVLAEIDLVILRYNLRAFVIYDDIFTLDKKRAHRFCEEFKKRKLKWRCWSRTNTVDKEMLKVMKDAGLVSITFGVESGDDRVLKNIKKDTTNASHKQALLACKELGIPVRCSLIYGNPGENLESVRNTIKLIEETQPDEWNLAVLAPIPGSGIWDEPEKYGVIFDKEWVKQNDYSMTNRFDSSGIGSIWIELKGISKEDFTKNLEFFVSELERVCPRKKIQDTIQSIDLKKIKILK
ncbi:MAG: radical SAM protein [Candidatus Omnitrophota bacterium]